MKSHLAARERACLGVAVSAAVLCLLTTRPAPAKPSAAPAPVAATTPSAAGTVPPGAAGTATPAPARAQMPTATATAAGIATPRPRGLTFSTEANLTTIDQNTNGPGQVAPEAPGFVAGTTPLSPNSPYDLFSSAPQVPGVAALAQIVETATARLPRFDAGVTAGFGYVRGSITNAAYWGENLLPALNPHLGSQALPYAIAFPRHPGGDDGTGTRLSILGGSLATADGRASLRAGYFDLVQTNRFVFAQPALTSVNPAIAYGTPESLSSGLAGLDRWQPYSTALPLHGVDLVVRRGLATAEVTSAALPSLPGEDARLTMASIVLDHGDGTRYSAQIVHARTSGSPFVTTVPFGTQPVFTTTPQGVLPTSVLDGQRQTIAGVAATFALAPALGLGAVAEAGRAWYDAAPVARPGTERPGGYDHLGLIETRGHATASVEYFRMEARYATIILPYGVPENQWSASFPWPGQWLKSNYQLIDNSVLGVNRQGIRLRYAVDRGPLEAHLEYVDLRQIEPETTQTSTQAGFVDGYYLPQAPDAATFGRQKRFGLWAAYHAPIGDLTLDVVDDELFRPFVRAHPEDTVSYEVPQATVTFARHISPAVLGSAGLGRYAAKGAFAEPIDFAERLFFAGVQVRETPVTTLQVTLRRTSFAGVTTFPGSPVSPDFTGTALIVEQRLTL